MFAATQDDLLAGILMGGAGLLVILLIWLVLHHARPQLKIDIGVRGWINLVRPPESDDSPHNGDGKDDRSAEDRDEDSGSDPAVGV